MRKKHLLHNTDNRTNKVWFKDKLGLEEMMAWIIDPDIFAEVEEKVKKVSTTRRNSFFFANNSK